MYSPHGYSPLEEPSDFGRGSLEQLRFCSCYLRTVESWLNRRTPSSGEGGTLSRSEHIALYQAYCLDYSAVCQHSDDSSRRKWKAKVWQEQMDGFNRGDFLECSESFRKFLKTFGNLAHKDTLKLKN